MAFVSIVATAGVCVGWIGTQYGPDAARAKDPRGQAEEHAPADEGFDPERSRLVEATLSERSTEYVNADGTTTVAHHSGPVRFKDEDGVWHDIDLTPTLDDGVWRPASAPTTTTIAEGRDRSITVETGGGPVVAEHRDGRPSVGSVGPVSVEFVDGLSDDRDLHVRLGAHGFEDSVLLESAAAGASYLVDFTLPAGAVARQDGDRVQFVGGDGRPIGFYGDGSAFDAATDEHFWARGEMPTEDLVAMVGVDEAEARARSHHHPVSVRLTGQEGDRASIEVGVDPAWLAAPDRVFPVTLDPTFYANTSQPTSRDGWVLNVYPDNAFSTNPDLIAGRTATGQLFRSFVYFDLNGGTTPLDGSGGQVSEAHMAINNFSAESCTAKPIGVHALAAPGFSNQTTWNNQPAGAALLADPSFAHGATGCAGAWENIDLTAAVRTWMTTLAPDFGVRLTANELDPSHLKKFYSGDSGASSAPALYITYTNNQAPTVPDSRNLAAGQTIENTTPVLSARYQDPDGHQGKNVYRIYNTVTAAFVGTGSGPDVASGQVSPWTVPAGLLTAGTLYTWVINGVDIYNMSSAETDWILFRIYKPGLNPACPADDLFEANDTKPTAAFGVTKLEAVSCAGDDDWFKLSLADGQELAPSLTTPAGKTLAIEIHSDSAQVTSGPNPVYRAAAAGTYYVRIVGGAATVTYTLDLLTQPYSACPVADDVFEANDTFSAAARFAPGPAVNGFLCGRPDVFRLEATGGTSVVATLTPGTLTGDLDLRLYRADGTFLSEAAGASGPAQLTVAALAAGTVVYAEVSGFDGATGSYTFAATGVK